ncbi:MAG: hypothetical protein QW478_00720 [Candidatus Micrarchaeaceae archaeon]
MSDCFFDVNLVVYQNTNLSEFLLKYNAFNIDNNLIQLKYKNSIFKLYISATPLSCHEYHIFIYNANDIKGFLYAKYLLNNNIIIHAVGKGKYILSENCEDPIKKLYYKYHCCILI